MKKRSWLSKIKRELILKLGYIDSDIYMKKYLKWLKDNGMKFTGKPNWISNDVYFDGTDYSLFELGENCTISREVLFLTHDFAFHTIFDDYTNNFLLPEVDFCFIKQLNKENQLIDLKPIHIGKNSFIGARAVVLPGTYIGDNCIIGAGSVIKGKVENNSIMIGNPAKKIYLTDEWVRKRSKILKTNIEKKQ